jgi:energy-coupling factor transporter ATP-binding protein EcfA2
VRDEDKLTLRETLFADTPIMDTRAFDEWVEKLGLGELLDLPRVALSNGQMRRARIVKALLRHPALLILDEPLSEPVRFYTADWVPDLHVAGLDVQMRPALLHLLQKMHSARNPRVIMGLRLQDPVPEWVSHVALVLDGRVQTGLKGEVLAEKAEKALAQPALPQQNTALQHGQQEREVVVDMKHVNVKYHTRHVRLSSQHVDSTFSQLPPLRRF